MGWCAHRRDLWLSAAGGRGSFYEKPGFDMQRSIPCGQCIGCRVSRKSEWVVRCSMELHMHDQACFVTATYADKSLPVNGSLCVRHWQLGMKRIRKMVASRGGPRVRYFSCGEYGPTTLRPHYHAILFGYWPSDAQRLYDAEFSSAELDKAWSLGHVRVSAVIPQRIGYVASHNVNVLSGDLSEFAYKRLDPLVQRIVAVERPRLLMSRNPGIGAPFLDRWLVDVVRPSQDGYRCHDGVVLPFGRFIDERVALVRPDIALLREQSRWNASQTEEAQRRHTPEALAAREQIAWRRAFDARKVAKL